MNDVRLVSLALEGFRTFRKHQMVKFPKTGLLLVRGDNPQQNCASGTGKSNFAMGISYALDYCHRPATALKSWDHEGRWGVDLELEVGEQEVCVSRGSSFSLDIDEKPVKGSAAAKTEALNRIIGLGPELLKPLTYRPQRTTGLFLSKTDEQKKEFLVKLIPLLDKFERESDAANERTKDLDAQLFTAKGAVERIQALIEHLDTQSYAIEATDGLAEEIAARQEKLQTVKEEAHTARLIVEGYIVETRNLQQAAVGEIDAKSEKIRAEWKVITDARPPIPDPEDTPDILRLRRAIDKASDMIFNLSKSDQELRAATEAQAKETRDLLLDLRKKAALLDTTQIQHDLACKEARILAEQKCDRCLRPWEGDDSNVALASVQTKISRLSTLLTTCREAKDAIPDHEAKLATLVFVANEKIEQLKKAREGANQKLWRAVAEARVEPDSIRARYKAEDAEFEKKLSFQRGERYDIEAQIRLEREGGLVKVQDDSLKVSMRLNECTRLLTEAEQMLAQIQASNKVRTTLEEKRRTDLTAAHDNLRAAWATHDGIKVTLNAEKDFALLTGREGYLSSIFTEILDEIAAEANSILIQVPNVQGVTLSFLNEKTTQKGTKRTGITALIHMDGQVRPFEDISGGQTSMVELATDIAIRRVITRRTGIHIGWMLLDESFDGLGKREKEQCLNVLQQAAQENLILVIDHASEFQEMFTQFIDIEFTGGESRFV